MLKMTKVLEKDVQRRVEELEGIKVADICVESTNIKSITLVDAKGTLIKFRYTDYNQVGVFATREPEYKEKWVLKGEYKGLVVNENYDYESDANTRLRELDAAETLVVKKELVEVTDND